MKTRGYLVLRIILLVGIFGTLLFTFTQSLLPPEESEEVSDGVRGFIAKIFPPDTPIGKFVQENARKIAHFTEYFILGIFTSLYVSVFMPKTNSLLKEKVRFIIYSFTSAPLVALFDETLQIFSGRGPAIVDVWLDTAGFFTSACIVYAVFYIVRHTINRRKQNNTV